MSPLIHLAIINFFIGDIQGGLGPFLMTWLAEVAHWGPGRVGLSSTIVGLATLALNGPAGFVADRAGRPRLLLALACGAILAGTLLSLPARSLPMVMGAQFLAAAGGTLALPAVTSLTLGIVGKTMFPAQQGRNQAFTHAGILAGAVLIGLGTRVLGPSAAFWVLGGMALGAIVAVIAMPAGAWNGRRAHGWDESEDTDRRHPMLSVLANRRLLLLAAALALFNLGNGAMLGLLGQRLAATGADATRWTAIYVVIAQGTMIPVALWAGSLADKRGRRQLLLVACAALVLRAAISAGVTSPLWLVPAEVLDGVASGLLGVAVPVLVADLTWGSGRTQTAYGVLNGLQGIGGALSGLLGGVLVDWLGWSAAFLALALAPAAAFALGWCLAETSSMEMPYPVRS